MYPLLTNEFCKLQIGPEEHSQFKEVKNQSFWNVKTVSSGELFCFHMTDSLCIVTNRTLISWTLFLLLITGPDSTPLVVGIFSYGTYVVQKAIFDTLFFCAMLCTNYYSTKHIWRHLKWCTLSGKELGNAFIYSGLKEMSENSR